MKNRGDTGDRGEELFPSEDEFEVSVILLELLELVERSQNRFFNVRWGAKKRRSAEEDYSSPAAAAAPTVSGGGGKSHPKVEASSPATPLCFSPSDTECKSRPSRWSVAKKKSIKELMEMVRALGAQQEQLKLEISKVIKYRDGLLDENLQLKSKQLKMKHRYGDPLDGRVDEGDPPTATRAAAPKPDRAPPSTATQPAENLRRRDETAKHAENLLRGRDGTASYVHVADLRYRAVEIPYAGIPDLNCSAVEEAGEEAAAVGFDFYGYEVASKAAAAAQARKRRLEIHRVKNSAAFKSQHHLQQQQRLR